MSTSSVTEMVTGKVTYQRLQHECGFDEERPDQEGLRSSSSRSSFRLKLRKVAVRKRLRFKVSSFRRFMMRRKRLVVSVLGVSCEKVAKRLKESKAHFGDLFSGNYLFLQVNPTPLKSHGNNSFSTNSTQRVA